MALTDKVAVRVLEPFGPHSVGNKILMEADRIDYLLEKKLVEKIDSKDIPAAEVSKSKDEDILQALSEAIKLDLPEKAEEILDFAEPAVKHIISLLSQRIGVEMPNPPGSEEDDDDGREATPFEEYLLANGIIPDVVSHLAANKLSTPEAIKAAEDKVLDALPNVGPTTVAVLKKLATDYKG